MLGLLHRIAEDVVWISARLPITPTDASTIFPHTNAEAVILQFQIDHDWLLTNAHLTPKHPLKR